MTVTTPVLTGARRSSFVHDVWSVAVRSLKLIPREPESVIPALVVPLFFFAVNTGSLSNLTGQIPSFDYKAFQLPVAIIFAVTGVSRASQLVVDIQDGYFNRMLLSPMRRQAILLGLMVSDFALVVSLSLPVMLVGWVAGIRFETGLLGALVFILLAGLWGVAFTGFPYAIALKTGSPAAVNSSFILFFPFAFLTTSFAPQEFLSGWLASVAEVNPVTYLLEGLRALVSDGWKGSALLHAVLAIAVVGAISQALAFLALRGRVRQR